MISILHIDDHSIVRAGIKSLLKDHFEVGDFDEAENETEAAAKIKKTKYDLILLDINLPNTDFSGLLQWILRVTPLSKTLVLTMHKEEVYGMRCINMGASGFLQKTAQKTEILNAVRTVLDNKKYISTKLSEIILENKTSKTVQNPFSCLSDRELEIANLLYSGKSLPEVCKILNIQYTTGNTYKRRIFEKLNVQTLISLSKLMQAYNIAGEQAD